MFDAIAPRYDLLNHVLSLGVDRRWRRRAVAALGISSTARLLDGCTGTADVLIDWLRRDPRCMGVGCDFSLPMLRLGQQKLATRGLTPRGALCRGDVSALPLADASFDGAVVAFGLRNVQRREQALLELRRVLRPGAPLVVLEFGLPHGLLGRAYALYFEAVLPRIGACVSGHRAAYVYLPSSVGRFPPVEGFGREMSEAGFADVVWRRLTGGIAWLCRGLATPFRTA